MTFAELETNIKKYLHLEDKGIIKLLCAAIIANRIPDLDPTWLFVVSSSSGGKSELLLALSYANGTLPMDDLTSKTLISGAKKAGIETSLIFRLPKNCVMVIKDLTVLLTKDPKESAAIFSQFRMIYDGTFNKSFGTGEDINAVVRMGLITGVTSVIEDYQADDAAVGQRAIKYYMEQPPKEKINDLTKEIVKGSQDKKMRVMMGQSFKEFLDNPAWNDLTTVPVLPDNVVDDISRLAEMATLARSSVKRKVYDREQRIERANLREMPFRFAKQLSNLAKGMMVMNGGDLTALDQNIIYKVALDSIPSTRKLVMMAATKFSRVALDGLAQEVKIPDESVKIHLDDLVSHEVMVREYSYGANKAFYYLREDYRQLISRFENIKMTNKTLEEEQPELKQPIDVRSELPAVEQQLLKEVGL